MNFYNISNHPSDSWDEKQRKAATNLVTAFDEEGIIIEDGNIQDIPFPNISPKVDWNAVNEIAFQLLEKEGLEMGEKKGNGGIEYLGRDICMVQGEATLTHILTLLLLERSYRVVVACSERNTIQENDKKIVRFSFCRFREIYTDIKIPYSLQSDQSDKTKNDGGKINIKENIHLKIPGTGTWNPTK